MSPVVTARVVQIRASPLMPSAAGPIGHHHGLLPSSFAQASGPYPINPYASDSPLSTVNPGLVTTAASAVPIPQFHNSQSASAGGLAPIPVPSGSLRPPGLQAMPMAPSAGSMLAGGTGKSSDRPATMPSSEGGRSHCNPASPPNGSCMAANAAPAPPRSGSCASRHMAAEQRRRARINERLEALREIVPHSARANTAAFLTEVYDYISSLHRELNKRGEPVHGPKVDKVSVHEETGEGDHDSRKGHQGSPQGDSPSQDGSHDLQHNGSSPGKPGLDLSLGLGDSSLSPAESPKGEPTEDVSGAMTGKVGASACFPNAGVAGRMPGRSGAFSAYVSAVKAVDKGEKSPGQPWPNPDACPETSSGKLPRHGKDADHNQETGSRSASIGEMEYKSDVEAENNDFSCSPDKTESLHGERFGLPQRAASNAGNLTALYTAHPEGSLSRIPFCPSPHSVHALSSGSDLEKGGKSAGQAYVLAPSPSAAPVMPMSAYLTGAAPGHGSGMMLVGNNQAARTLPNGSFASRKRKDAGCGIGQHHEEQGSQSYTHAHGHAHSSAPGGTSSPAPAAHPGAGPPSGYPVMVPMLPPMHPVAMAAAAAAAADAAAAAAVQQWNMAAAVAQAQAQAAVQAHAQAQALASAVAASSASAAAAAGSSHLSMSVSLPLPGSAPRTLRSSSPPHPQMGHAPPQGVHPQNALGAAAGGLVATSTRPVAVTSANGQVSKRRRKNTQESKDGNSCIPAQKVVRPIAVRPRP